MRIGSRIVGAFLILAGAVWFLQGISILPGTYMSGQIQWAVYGALAVAAGIGLIVWGSRGGRSQA